MFLGKKRKKVQKEMSLLWIEHSTSRYRTGVTTEVNFSLALSPK
jgi:hypothetical protein